VVQAHPLRQRPRHRPPVHHLMPRSSGRISCLGATSATGASRATGGQRFHGQKRGERQRGWRYGSGRWCSGRTPGMRREGGVRDPTGTDVSTLRRCGNNSIGRVAAFHAACCGSESRFPLHAPSGRRSFWAMAQVVAHLALDQAVVGSRPTCPAGKRPGKERVLLHFGESFSGRTVRFGRANRGSTPLSPATLGGLPIVCLARQPFGRVAERLIALVPKTSRVSNQHLREFKSPPFLQDTCPMSAGEAPKLVYRGVLLRRCAAMPCHAVPWVHIPLFRRRSGPASRRGRSAGNHASLV